MDLSADLRDALGEFAESVTLSDGKVVLGAPSVASAQDALSGDSVVCGRTRTLRFVSSDVPLLQPGHTLTWQGKVWRVTSIQLAAMGQLTRAFLGAS